MKEPKSEAANQDGESALASAHGSARRQLTCTIYALIVGLNVLGSMLAPWPITKAVGFLTALMALCAVWVFARD